MPFGRGYGRLGGGYGRGGAGASGGGSGLSVSYPLTITFDDADQPFSMAGANQIIFADSKGGDTTFTLTMAFTGGGTINFDDTAYAALTQNSGGDGTSAIDVTGSLANINAAFADPEPVLAGLSGETASLSFTLTGDTTGRTRSGTILVTSVTADVTAPVLTAADDTKTGVTTATITVDTDEGNGVLYWVLSSSATAPSAAQVKAGNDHTGSPALESGSAAVAGTGTQTINVTGLTGATTYYAHFMQEDDAFNQSNVDSGDGFITDAADVTAPTISPPLSPADNATGIAVGANLVATFDENIALGTGDIVLVETGVGPVETFNVATGLGDNGGTVSASGTQVTINPGANLSNLTAYHVTIASTAVEDLAGNAFAGISDATVWNFTTVASGAFIPSRDFSNARNTIYVVI